MRPFQFTSINIRMFYYLRYRWWSDLMHEYYKSMLRGIMLCNTAYLIVDDEIISTVRASHLQGDLRARFGVGLTLQSQFSEHALDGDPVAEVTLRRLHGDGVLMPLGERSFPWPRVRQRDVPREADCKGASIWTPPLTPPTPHIGTTQLHPHSRALVQTILNTTNL